MAISIELPPDLFDLIQKSAIPFKDLTPASVIRRWADFYITHETDTKAAASTEVEPTRSETRTFSNGAPPDLLHTTVRGEINGSSFRKWNELVRLAHRYAFKLDRNVEKLRAVTHAQIRAGDHEGDSGFHFIPDIGLSVQGVDANHAWKYSLRLAQHCKILIEARFEWRNTPKAAFPGESGVLRWSPTNIHK